MNNITFFRCCDLRRTTNQTSDTSDNNNTTPPADRPIVRNKFDSVAADVEMLQFANRPDSSRAGDSLASVNTVNCVFANIKYVCSELVRHATHTQTQSRAVQLRTRRQVTRRQIAQTDTPTDTNSNVAANAAVEAIVGTSFEQVQPCFARRAACRRAAAKHHQ